MLFGAAPAQAMPLPLRSLAPELLACALTALAGLMLACILLRRSLASAECAHTLALQLATEREARWMADQALAEQDELLCSLVCRDEAPLGVAAPGRATPDPRLVRRLVSLRTELSQLHDSLAGDSPEAGQRLGDALRKLDGVLQVVAAARGGRAPPPPAPRERMEAAA
ncbi:hypothetical protein B0920_06005 [Massilia sp. KIM]|nr:hypothetical protein B0920_06005 [Massilia sp. KIM]